MASKKLQILLTNDDGIRSPGLWAAAEAPELVSGLVLIGPSVRGNFNQPTKWLLRVLFARPWGPAMWSWYFNKLFTTRKPADLDAYRTGLRRNLAEPGRMESLVQMMVSPQTAAEERLPRVSAQTLVLMGDKDPDFKPEIEARFVASSLRAPYHMIEGAGHYPHVEMPEVTTPLILGFLQSVKEKDDKVYVA
jgi:pimeloyl-ACP methyl ester carboxylesterase